MTENTFITNQPTANQPWSQNPSPLDVPTPISNNGTPAAQKGSMKTSKLALILFGIAILAGVGTGTGLFKLSAKSGIGPDLSDSAAPIAQVAGNNVKEGDVFGSADESTFKDKAEGYLEIGGVNGEGSHHLLRAGGPSQTVYLTSSVTDLDKFQGMEVKVWGETFKAQNAGWLMDVGRVQVVKVKGALPEGNTPAKSATSDEEGE